MAFTGVTNAPGPSPQPTACKSPSCSLTTGPRQGLNLPRPRSLALLLPIGGRLLTVESTAAILHQSFTKQQQQQPPHLEAVSVQGFFRRSMLQFFFRPFPVFLLHLSEFEQ